MMKLDKYFTLIYLMLWGYSLVVFFSSFPSAPKQIIEIAFRYVRVLWICWVLMIGLAIYIKWKKNSSLLFYLIYGMNAINILLLAGLFFQVPSAALPEKFSHLELKLFFTTGLLFVLTGLLQLAVRWFTTRPHRRMK